MMRAAPCLALALLLAAPLLLGSQALGLMVQMGIAVVLCLSFWLLMGQGGMVSFGHALYSGLGAFAAIHMLRTLQEATSGNLGGVPATLLIPVLPLAGGLAAAFMAWIFGWLATRHDSGTAFAMITLGLGELVWAGAQMFPAIFGGEAGISADRSAGALPGRWNWGPVWQVYLLALVYTLASAWLIYRYTLTPMGALLQAVRDKSQRVAFLGQDPRRIRHISFVVAGFFAGVAGGLAALFNEIVSSEALSSQRSAAVLVFTLMGGLSTWVGPALGGVLMVLVTVVLSGWTQAWLLYMGLAFMLVLLLLPRGLAPGLAQLYRAVQARPLASVLQALALLGAATGMGAALEMAYQLRLAPTVGSELAYLGIRLDAHAPADWLGSLAVALLGLGAWRWGAARVRR